MMRLWPSSKRTTTFFPNRMPEESDVVKISLVADATQLDKTVQEREQKFKDFKKLTNEQARIRLTATVVELQGNLDDARKRLRDFKKAGDADAVLKARLDIQGLQTGMTSAKSALRQIKKDADDAGGSFFNLNRIVKDSIKAFLGFGVIRGIVGFFKGAVDEAKAFDTAFTGVRKTVDATEEEFAKLKAGFKDLALEKDVSGTSAELAKIGETAGQLGIKKDSIIAFTKTIDQLAVSTNLTVESASEDLAKFANIFQTPADKFQNLGSVIVDLGNKTATTEADILNFGTRIAAAGKIAGLTEADVFAIAAAFSSVGVNSEEGGTAVQKALNAITTAVATGNKDLGMFAETAGLSAEKFKTLWQTDASAAFEAFVTGLGKGGTKSIQILDDMGLGNERVVKAFLSLGSNSELLSMSLDAASDAYIKNTALSEEAARKAESDAEKFKDFGKIVSSIKLIIGDFIVGAILPMADALGNLLLGIKEGEISFKSFGGVLTIAGTVLGAVLIPGFAALAVSLAPLAALLYAAGFAMKNWNDEAKRAAATLEVLERAATATDALSASLIKFQEATANNNLDRTTESMEQASKATALLQEEIQRLGEQSNLSQKEIDSFHRKVGATGDIERAVEVVEVFRKTAADSFETVAAKAQEAFARITATQKDLTYAEAVAAVKGLSGENEATWREIVKTIAVNVAKAGDLGNSFAIFIANGIQGPEAVNTLAKAGVTAVEIMRSEIGRQELSKFSVLGQALAGALRDGLFGIITAFIPNFKATITRLTAPLTALGIDTSRVGKALGSVFVGIVKNMSPLGNAASTAFGAMKSGAAGATEQTKELDAATGGAVKTLKSMQNEVDTLQKELLKAPVGSKEFADTAAKLKDLRTEMAALNKEAKTGGSAAKKATMEEKDAIIDAKDELDKYQSKIDDTIDRTEKLAESTVKFFEDIRDSIASAQDEQAKLTKNLEDFKKEQSGEFIQSSAERDVELAQEAKDIQDEIAEKKKDATDDETKSAEKLKKAQDDLLILEKKRNEFTDKTKDSTKTKMEQDIAAKKKLIEDLSKEAGGVAEILDLQEKLKKVESERAEIQAFLTSQTPEVQKQFEDSKKVEEGSEFSQNKKKMEDRVKEEEEAVAAEIAKQQKIIDIQELFQGISQAKDREHLRARAILRNTLGKEGGMTNLEDFNKFLEGQGIEGLTKQEQLDALRQAQAVIALDNEKKAVETQQQEILATKEQYFGLVEQAYSDSIARQKIVTQELIDQILNAQREQRILNDLRAGGSGAIVNNNNNSSSVNVGPVNVAKEVDGDALIKKVESSLSRSIQLKRKNSSK